MCFIRDLSAVCSIPLFVLYGFALSPLVPSLTKRNIHIDMTDKKPSKPTIFYYK
jgi:hypothetical protein